MNFNTGELFKRAIKYLVEGLLVAIAAYAIPQRQLKLDEIMLIALTAAATFSILDTYVPSINVNIHPFSFFSLKVSLDNTLNIESLLQ